MEVPVYNNISFGWLMVVVPFLWISGVNLGYFLGKWIDFFNQFGKFSAIGLTNASIDFGILNVLIAWSGIAVGVWFAVFKAVSFLAAVVHSYFWNRYWVFESGNEDRGREFFKFFSVYVVAILINVGVASFVVNFVDPFFNLNVNVWANMGAVIGSAIALTFSFVGVRMVVFKKEVSGI